MKRHKFGKTIAVIIAGAMTFGLGAGLGECVFNWLNPKPNQSAYADVVPYMLQGNDGVACTLPVNENPISVVIKNLSEEDKNKVIESVITLDSISTNLNYKILETDDVSIKEKIIIEDADLKSGVLGETTFEFNNTTGRIYYPIVIKIDLDDCHKRYSTITGEDAVKTVTKHELGHTLGFKDLYDRQSRDESLMYYTLAKNETYTEIDEQRIRKVYGGAREEIDPASYYETSVPENMRLARQTPFYSVYEPASITLTYDKNFNFSNNAENKKSEQEREL